MKTKTVLPSREDEEGQRRTSKEPSFPAGNVSAATHSVFHGFIAAHHQRVGVLSRCLLHFGLFSAVLLQFPPAVFHPRTFSSGRSGEPGRCFLVSLRGFSGAVSPHSSLLQLLLGPSPVITTHQSVTASKEKKQAASRTCPPGHFPQPTSIKSTRKRVWCVSSEPRHIIGI